MLSVLALPFAAALFLLVGGARLVQGHNLALRRAERDPLTGLGNRRYFDDRLAGEVATAQSRRAPLVLAVLDLDDFKAINDTHGHHRGDEVLAAVASALRAGRRADTAFRLGGDEFAVLMPNIGLEGARHAMQRRADALAQDESFRGIQCGSGAAARRRRHGPRDVGTRRRSLLRRQAPPRHRGTRTRRSNGSGRVASRRLTHRRGAEYLRRSEPLVAA
ncbi:MAG: GGDEF domain-containing protein [Actinomycetota bacterium]|nr:GGDEF domain-containing protein [Actinomycetota bacterium]